VAVDGHLSAIRAWLGLLTVDGRLLIASPTSNWYGSDVTMTEQEERERPERSQARGHEGGGRRAARRARDEMLPGRDRDQRRGYAGQSPADLAPLVADEMPDADPEERRERERATFHGMQGADTSAGPERPSHEELPGGAPTVSGRSEFVDGQPAAPERDTGQAPE
jgi:hypothetical protein